MQKTTDLKENTESKQNDLYTWEATNIFIIDVYVYWYTLKIEYSKFVDRVKIQSKDNFQKSKKWLLEQDLGYHNSANSNLIMI